MRGFRHDRRRLEVVLERDEQRLRSGDRAEERQDEVGENVAVAVERGNDERLARRREQQRERRVDQLRFVRDFGMALGGEVHLLLEHPLVRRADRVLRAAEHLRSGSVRLAKRELRDGVADAPFDALLAERHFVIAFALAPFLGAVRVADRHADDRDRRVARPRPERRPESAGRCGR